MRGSSSLPLSAELQGRIAEMRQRHDKSERVAFTEIVAFKEEILATFFLQNPRSIFSQVPEDFAAQRWLVEYAIFRSLKKHFGGGAWYQWSFDRAASQSCLQPRRTRAPKPLLRTALLMPMKSIFIFGYSICCTSSSPK
jgi:4-alpha-glucanotransferase